MKAIESQGPSGCRLSCHGSIRGGDGLCLHSTYQNTSVKRTAPSFVTRTPHGVPPLHPLATDQAAAATGVSARDSRKFRLPVRGRLPHSSVCRCQKGFKRDYVRLRMGYNLPDPTYFAAALASGGWMKLGLIDGLTSFACILRYVTNNQLDSERGCASGTAPCFRPSQSDYH